VTSAVRPRGGAAWVSGLRVRTGRTKIRLPDVVAMLDRSDRRAAEEVFEGADLVVEVVSGDESDRHRDLVEKRAEYADARIPEYWIVDPVERRITVLALRDGGYVEHCVAEDGAIAPGSPYALSKLAQEMRTLRAPAEDGLDVVVVRPFNHTGARQARGRIREQRVDVDDVARSDAQDWLRFGPVVSVRHGVGRRRQAMGFRRLRGGGGHQRDQERAEFRAHHCTLAGFARSTPTW